MSWKYFSTTMYIVDDNFHDLIIFLKLKEKDFL